MNLNKWKLITKTGTIRGPKHGSNDIDDRDKKFQVLTNLGLILMTFCKYKREVVVFIYATSYRSVVGCNQL